MSGIYIPMEMPTGDNNITLFLYPDGKVVVGGMLGPLSHYEAVPVPDHGRTIDGDVLCKVLQKNSEDEWNKTVAPFSWSYAYECVKDTVENMPTIIPADHIGDANEMVADKEGE